MTGPRVVVCQPIRGNMPASAHQSQVALFAANWDVICGFSFVNNTYLDKARNMCVEQAQKLEASHILWLDADMAVPSDTIRRLLAHDREVVGGLYFQRQAPWNPVAWSLTEAENGQTDFELLKDVPDSGLVRVDGIGTGCLLTTIDIYDRVGVPWFAATYGHDGDLYFLGEDVFLSFRLKQLEIPVWLDCDLACGHVTDYTVTRADWERDKDLG